MSTIESIIIAIVEGLTEFLPISSTGHMIITEKLLGITETEFIKVFTVAIQLGAILAVVVLYWKKFFNFKQWQFYVKLAAAVIPALVFGFIFSKKIDALLDSALTVAITLLLGGVILLFIDKLFKHPTIESEEKISLPKAVAIGFWQCIAMVPGVSRSAASIIGGMQQNLTRSAAAEFSFFLAVPTMLAATTYKLYKYYKDFGGFTSVEIKQLAIGNVAAFIVAILAIKFFIGFVKKYGFKVWGVYRIIVGVVLLLLIWKGVIS
ncbi:undecaprenyl-diphosphate phosphatase [Ferruginibacter sp. SUN002]|uniref:undecaprenyl-diphosphate phosphatase n=1 Tax=Ferruginibacter sp. SUN002 TaxID=2937789 RepID=UPI003D36789D